jgi:hypothetical protein
MNKNDRQSGYDFFLILLANRFNSAYYLLLNTGDWSGGETSSGCRLLGVVENAPNCRAPEVHAADETPQWRTEESFPFLEEFFCTS